MQTDTLIRRTYRQFRLKAGMPARQALYAAKAKIAFDDLEEQGLVRLRAVPEEESYFDMYGVPEAYVDLNGRRVDAEQAKIETEELLERTGCWVVIAEAFNGHAWESCDSIGMNTGYENPLSPFENWYVPDLMANAVQAAECCQAEQLGVLTLR